jgi:DNA transposition AAA+ family ATPase
MKRTFVKTRQYRKFAELCNSCSEDKYIGICHGLPGVGKSLSAKQYATGNVVAPSEGQAGENAPAPVVTALYTATPANYPRQLDREITVIRNELRRTCVEMRRLDEDMQAKLKQARTQLNKHKAYTEENRDWLPRERSIDSLKCAVAEIINETNRQTEAVRDHTSLLIVDEKDHLRMSSLEQVRTIYDRDDIGLVLMGMPGLEKRLARYPQLYSRVGFVHEFKPLDKQDFFSLIRDEWRPQSIPLERDHWTDEEGLAGIFRVAAGNFRLLDRLLSQIDRIVKLNNLDLVTRQVVDKAREAMVIGGV